MFQSLYDFVYHLFLRFNDFGLGIDFELYGPQFLLVCVVLYLLIVFSMFYFLFKFVRWFF